MNIINLSEHKRIDFTPAAAVAAGDVVIDGCIKGYATGALAAGARGSLVLEAICEGDKVNTEAWSRGEKIYWDATAEKFTTTATGNTLIGCAESDADETAERGRVLWDFRLGADGTDGAAGADGADGADGSVPGGSYTVQAADDTAGTTDIVTGLTSIDSFHVQILRAGVNVTDDAVLSAAGGTITVADGAANYALTAGDVINWLAAGTV